MKHPYLGIDVGGTKTEVVLLNLKTPSNFESYEIVARKRIPTDRSHGLQGFLNSISSLIEEILSSSNLPLSEVHGIGVGLPGSIHPGESKMSQGSIPFFKDLDLKSVFQEKLSYSGPIVFENDANCFAIAESYFGAGRTWAKQNSIPPPSLCLLGVTLGTGVGGGIIMNGKLIRGRRGGAGEIGHMTLKEADRTCYCGKSGCAEQFLSGPGLELAYRNRAHSAHLVPGKQIFSLSRGGDPFARSTLDAYREHLVQFLSNLSNLLDPHVIVLGGGLSLEPEIYQGIETRLSEGCFLTESPPSVIQHELGDAAGALGAAYLAFLAPQPNLKEECQ